LRCSVEDNSDAVGVAVLSDFKEGTEGVNDTEARDGARGMLARFLPFASSLKIPVPLETTVNRFGVEDIVDGLYLLGLSPLLAPFKSV
jgi:hypothetical protein